MGKDKYRFIAHLPSIPGVDTTHESQQTAEREIATAKQQGFDISEAEILVVLMLS